MNADPILQMALDLALFSQRVRRQRRLPHSLREEVQRIAVRVVAVLQGRDVALVGALDTKEAETAPWGVLDALKASGISNATIAAVVNRHAERSAAPVMPAGALSKSDRAEAT